MSVFGISLSSGLSNHFGFKPVCSVAETNLSLKIVDKETTVKFLNFWTPENFVVNYLKFKQKCQTLGYFVK